MFTQHMAEQIFLYASKALDALDENWKNNILSVTTDGERKMTGHIQGVVTRFEQCAKPGFFIGVFGMVSINWICACKSFTPI